jgi:signal transduction histidine kinase
VIPTRVWALVGGRLPAPIEAGAYFVAAEALTNAGKHARATHIDVSARRCDGSLLLAVVDDGVGGADEARGSGLAGLADRVAALGGQLRVESPVEGGTRVLAEFPCE